MGRATIALGAVLIVAGGGALGYGFTRKATGGMTPEATTAMIQAMGQLDGDLKSARGQVHERAVNLAGLRPVRQVVEGDVDSARDAQAQGDLQFNPNALEVVEIGHLEGGKPVPLLTQPEGAKFRSHTGKTMSWLDLEGSDVVVAEVIETVPLPVTPQPGVEPTPSKGGYVGVMRKLALGEAIARLAAAKIDGRFELGEKSTPIGRPIAAGVKTETRQLLSEPAAHIVVAVPPTVASLPVGVVGAGTGAAAIGLLLLVLGMLSSGQQAARTATRDPALASTEPGISGPASRPGFQTAPTGVTGPHDPSNPPQPSPSGSFSDLGSEFAPGQMIGRWEVIRRLGSGGMADVYMARSKGEAGFEKLVAVKVMHAHLARNQRAVEHFLDEARLAARIAHPNVVAIQDLGKIGNDYVIVMDYVEGVDLERVLASARGGGRPVPIAVGLGILCRICDGLNAAHTAVGADGMPLGVIHRDVKSANVLVSRQGGVKVVDFGIAKAANQSHVTVAGETKGTPSMMAPEQRVGERVDVRADVYSVSAVGFEILTGHAVNLDLVALAHLGVEKWPHLPPPSEVRPDLPVELDAVVLGAMSFDREKRPANCATFEAILEAVMKRHGYAATDKDIARWIESELRLMVPPFQGATSTPNLSA